MMQRRQNWGADNSMAIVGTVGAEASEDERGVILGVMEPTSIVVSSRDDDLAPDLWTTISMADIDGHSDSNAVGPGVSRTRAPN
jgi:hypothetical protein